ncbi:hypothetical protein [Grimontia sp. NTOU-MAR1]|uniref:hypothetical protein n=1 Tax=Grimontia sp. NTOU-MAR1 TaxID=3111011 RepID=UPI002DB7F1AF|nr:hypothetical protein [Grimontia sp. NTOU-MAR1]WRV98552.1 hypothetical protein VP504_03695 [Grimontia sp. NTOU-MAR1]
MGEVFEVLLLILACTPILYWVSKLIVAFILYKFSPPHYVTMELEDSKGYVVKSEVVDVSKDKNFYAAVAKIYQSSQQKEGNAS